MPIYEYQCQHCHYRFEEIQKMGEAPITLCPQCQQHQVRRLISAAGFQLKGTGWYVTDFKNKGKPQAATSADTVEASTKASSSTLSGSEAPKSSTEASKQSEK